MQVDSAGCYPRPANTVELTCSTGAQLQTNAPELVLDQQSGHDANTVRWLSLCMFTTSQLFVVVGLLVLALVVFQGLLRREDRHK